MRAVFFGTPLFAAKTVESLIEKGINIVAIVSKPDKPKGRGRAIEPTSVKRASEKFPNIPLFQPPIASDPAFIKTVASLHPDLFIVVAYGEIMKEPLLEVAAVASINLHTSLLPKYRGAAPIQRAIMAGETKSGVTIIHMAKKMDAGDILLQKELVIESEDTFATVEQKLLEIGEAALFEAIDLIEKGKSSRFPQDHSLATFAPKVELEECEIRLRDQSAEEIHNLVRGTYPEPGAFCWIELHGEKKRLKVFSTKKQTLPQALPEALSGTVLSWGSEGLILAAKEGAIEFLEVQMEGKKRLPAELFMRGISREAMRW